MFPNFCSFVDTSKRYLLSSCSVNRFHSAFPKFLIHRRCDPIIGMDMLPILLTTGRYWLCQKILLEAADVNVSRCLASKARTIHHCLSTLITSFIFPHLVMTIKECLIGTRHPEFPGCSLLTKLIYPIFVSTTWTLSSLVAVRRNSISDVTMDLCFATMRL